VNWGYSWGGNRFTTFTLRPIDVGMVKVNYLDRDYIENQRNPYLRESYRDQLLAGISGTWSYNNSAWSRRGNALNIRLNWETKGNLLYGANRLLGGRHEGETFYRMAGIQFAQYVRADLAVVNSIALGGRSNLVWRLYGGAGITYGNSHGEPIPYDRLFYAGGSNSMRGWVARTLGPGSEPRPEGELYPSQLGNMRLEANLEARFPIWSILRGALFMDAGNVWLMGPGEYTDASRFTSRSFIGQTALNTGLGLRFDISMAVIRLDWGIRLHDPNLPGGERWTDSFSLRGTALSVGVGYPF
jgi:outer membrane protein assembly factor BamA